ncbi:Rhodocoxin [Zhongshania aliphaticivorans]|uniref:Rhodocoxin n=1 Tax=Zhongshania aliphaticivorans TaxID=1470434 RepID=A0A5S9MUL9_9GAMM|nr:ferredoxin [Zhongshania aliphaticivorans]CAA0081104.1 Rhodocoxin [Zhongshania aliphaticivorans]CAA0085132.1 Rhodocoxin [Zhongshania aliphaticivorans]
MQVIVTDRSGDVAEYDVSEFSELFSVLGDELKIDALCGGCCSCATCHIYTEISDEKYLSDCTEEEQDILDGLLHVQAGSRLLCQLSKKENVDSLKITIAQAE